MGIKEKALILPALYIINKNNSATTSDLIKELTSIFHPTGEDAEILAGRKDTKFSQKVRNLVSHRDNNMMKEFTDFKKGIYTLTVAGKKYLDDNICHQILLIMMIFKSSLLTQSKQKEKNER